MRALSLSNSNARACVLRGLMLAAMVPSLTGCVAAVVPLAAGGALLSKGKQSDKDSPNAEQVADPAASVKVDAAVEQAATADAQPAELAMGELPPSESGLEELFTQASETAASEELAPSDIPPTQNAGRTATASSPAPAPAPVTAPIAASSPASTGPADFRAYDALYAYVDQQVRRDPTQQARQSAILAAPGSLRPRRSDCGILPPAILIDLDPADGLFDPQAMRQADPSLKQILLSLRLQAVDIFWISGRTAIEAGSIRAALRESGLDPERRDELLVLRRADDRKQIHRRDLSETHCLLAIAGDQRADFDELFQYLKDPSAAQPLEELIAAGWFLTPLPLTASPEGTSP